MRWGFSGWTKIEYDISANGETLNVRPVVAYPPFVFGAAAAKAADRFRYYPSFRPDGGLGCGGKTFNVAVRMAD